MMSVSGDERYNCPRSEPLHVMPSLLEESNRRRDLRRLFLRKRIDFDLCNVGRCLAGDAPDDGIGGGGGSLSLSIFSAMFHIVLSLLLLTLLLAFWTTARAENGEEGWAPVGGGIRTAP